MSTATAIRLPSSFSFKRHDAYDFEPVLATLDWEIENAPVIIDLSQCSSAHYQALALLVPYAWWLRCRGCRVQIELDPDRSRRGASAMWRQMGAPGWNYALRDPSRQFKGNPLKPLFAVRNSADFGTVQTAIGQYTKPFDLEYEKTVHYIVAELLYNTMEHGRRNCRLNGADVTFPSAAQFSWYRQRNELGFVIADCGVGVKRHLEQHYPVFESHADALRMAIQPEVSGTFGRRDPYRAQNNAGVGLFISAGIVQRLHADMFLISGNGLLHVSPRDIATRTVSTPWPGTIAFLSMRLGEAGEAFTLQQMMATLRERARDEIASADARSQAERHNVEIRNYFGRYAENKEEAATFRDRHLLPAVDAGHAVVLDFRDVAQATHSFLSALLATAIQRMGLAAYKKLRVVNAAPEIRETIDYILDSNTRE